MHDIHLLNFFQGFGFNLANALAGYAEFLAHFFQGMGHAIAQAKPHFQNTLFTRGQILNSIFNIVAQNLQGGRAVGRNIFYVFNKIALGGIVVVIAHRNFQRHGILRNFNDVINFFHFLAHFSGQLLGCGIAAQILR